LFHHLKQVLGLPVRDVHFTESGGASGILVIAMKKAYPEQVKEVAFGAWALMNKECKFTIVVDEDIDVRNSFQVEWAMSFHAQPARDSFTVSGVVPSGVDPSTAAADVPQHDPRRRAGSKILIDATRSTPTRHPPACRGSTLKRRRKNGRNTGSSNNNESAYSRSDWRSSLRRSPRCRKGACFGD